MRRNVTQAIGAVLLGLCALLSPAASQTQPDAVQLYMLQLLGSPDPALRQRAQRELEAAAPTFPPPALFLVASRLAEAGEFEAALYWSHIAEIRLRTDAALFPAGLTGIGIDSNGFAEMMTVWMDEQLPPRQNRPSAERRRQILARAVRAEASIERRYRSDWLQAEMDPAGATPAAPWPSRRDLTRARSNAVAAVRTRVENAVRFDQEETAIERQIARGEIPAEAQSLIPETLRTRVVPRVALDIATSQCQQVAEINPTPQSARTPMFVIECRQRGAFGVRSVWIGQADGALRGTVSQPEGAGRTGALAVRGGEVFSAYNNSAGRDIVLLASDGRIEQLTPPEGAPALRMLQSITRSGRYGVYGPGRPAGVLDIETNRWIWIAPVEATANAGNALVPRLRVGHVEESPEGAPLLIGLRGSGEGAELVWRDLLTNRERSVGAPNGVSLTVRSEGSAALVTQSAPAAVSSPEIPEPGVRTYANQEEWRAANPRTPPPDRSAPSPAILIDLERGERVWSGAANVAPPDGVASCSVTPNPSRISALASRFATNNTLRVGEDEAVLGTVARGSISGCAISRDGRRLILTVSPFAYIYDIAP